MTLGGAFRSITTTCNALQSETLRRDWIGGSDLLVTAPVVTLGRPESWRDGPVTRLGCRHRC